MASMDFFLLILFCLVLFCFSSEWLFLRMFDREFINIYFIFDFCSNFAIIEKQRKHTRVYTILSAFGIQLFSVPFFFYLAHFLIVCLFNMSRNGHFSALHINLKLFMMFTLARWCWLFTLHNININWLDKTYAVSELW